MKTYLTTLMAVMLITLGFAAGCAAGHYEGQAGAYRLILVETGGIMAAPMEQAGRTRGMK